MVTLVNRAKMATSTTGTGTITLGSAVTGFQTFADAGITNGMTVRYVIENGDNFEIGSGTYTASGTTLSRSVSESSNSDSALNLSGSSEVFLTAIAADIDAKLDKAGGTMTGVLAMGSNAITTSSTVDGRDVSADGTKLDAIEASADVTDTANVTAAGALMDSEVTNLSEVKAFDASDYATAAQGTLATNALPKSGGTITGTTNFATDVKLEFGDTSSPELAIYSIGSSSMIDETGVGYLYIRANDLILGKYTGETYIRCYDDDRVDIYFDNSIKLSTTSTGISVTGNVVVSGTVDGRDVATDGTKLDAIEASADVTDASNVTAAGALMDSEVTNLAQVKAFASSDYATAAQGTTADAALPKAGGTMTGNLSFGDDVKAKFGASSDLQMYHDGSNSYITESGTGALALQSNGTAIVLEQTDGENMILANVNGDVKLYYDGSEKLATTSTGIDVTGTVASDVLLTSDNNTDDTNKVGTIISRQYDSGTETEGFLIAQTFANSSSNKIDIGGGTSQRNASTEINFHTASDTTTRTGTKRLGINSSGIDVTGNIVVSGTVDGRDIATDGTKLDGIEANATADQTKSDIEGLGIDLPAGNLTGTIAAARLSTATTQAESDDSTKIATTAYVTDKITTLIGGAPSTLNDLNELAAAINDDANYNSTLTTALGTKLPKAGGTMTGAIEMGSNAITSAGNLSLDVAGYVDIDADDGGVYFTDGGTTFGRIYNSSSNLRIKSQIGDKDISFEGVDGSSAITALQLDMSEGGRANFNNDISLDDGRVLRLGTGDDTSIYNDGSHFNIVNTTSNHDMLFKGNDDGSNITALTLDMSDAGKATFNGGIVSNAGVVVDNITIDGSSITAGSANDLTIDAVGNIILDADGGDIKFKDGGTAFGGIFKSGNDLYLQSDISDGDIKFYGNDGGSAITALTLDMSAGGNAIFNQHAYFPDNGYIVLGAGEDVKIHSDGTNGTIASQNGNLTLDAAGDITLDADGADILFKDGGTTFGSIINSSSDFQLNANVQDKDIKFTGNDGGSGITALTLDMSDAGNATFNDGATFGSGIVAPRIKSTQVTVAANSSSTALDFSTSNNFMVNMTADTTFSFSNIAGAVGCSGNIIIVQDATGSRDFTLPSEAKTPVNGATIVQNTGANEISVLSYYVMSSSQVLVNYIGDFA